jgi:ornithine carbamoyltransferase
MAYVGDGNNVTRSLLHGAMLTGMQMAIASPAGYTLREEDWDTAESLRTKGASFEIYDDPTAAVANADIIYTDVWTSMGQEEETAKRLAVFPPYQVNPNLLAHAKPDCLVMHCLPAHRGEEITDEVADSAQSIIFPQAENRLHAQKAILAHLL